MPEINQGTIAVLQSLREAMGKRAIDDKAVEEATQILRKYKEGKANLEKRIVEEERWWKLRHWEVINNKGKGCENKAERPEPASAWLFNSISGKHADIMDNYPEPNVLPREQSDEEDAKILSSVLPVVFERNHYEDTYSTAAWYKLKHGFVAKSVLWDTALEDGMGDIAINFADALNLFWEPGITDIQDSRHLFNVTLMDNDLLEQRYPQLKKNLGGQVIDVQEYVYDDNVDTSEKSAVVDWYYKKQLEDGRTILHYAKFVGSEVLFATENEPETYPNGLYDHGQYPFVFDVLFPEAGTPIGFGYIAVMKSPQMYIDKLNQVVLENSIKAAAPRWFAKKNVGINLEQYKDWSQQIVDVEGEISEERLRQIEVAPVHGNVLTVLQMKVDELKETSSNRDVSQGSSGGGVTSGAAIAALQEAGNKTSRDMISASYRSFTKECYLAIELIRQFYDEKRSFRVTGKTGKSEFVQLDNSTLRGRPIPEAYPGQSAELGYIPALRRPVFDIVVKAQKRSPYSRMAQNELAKELYHMGFFNPQMSDQSLAALDLMDFEGLEKVRERVEMNRTLAQMVQMQNEQITKMGAIIYGLTGQDVLGNGIQPAPAGAPEGGKPSGRTIAKAQQNAQKATMADYGARLAANAKPDMNRG